MRTHIHHHANEDRFKTKIFIIKVVYISYTRFFGISQQIPFMDFPVVTLYSLVDGYAHFRETCFFHHQCTANTKLRPTSHEVGTHLQGTWQHNPHLKTVQSQFQYTSLIQHNKTTTST